MLLGVTTGFPSYTCCFFCPLPSAITALKEQIGWRYSLLSIGVLQLSIVVCGSLLRPIIIKEQEEAKVQPPEEPAETKYMLENEQTRTSIESIDSGVEITTSPSNVPGNTKAEPKSEEPKEHVQILVENHSTPPEPKTKLLDFSVMRDYSFICYAFFGLFATLGFFAPSLYIIPLSLSLGIGKDHSAYILSAMAIAEVLGRISAGWVLNKKPIRKIYIELICVVLLSVALFAFPFASGFWGLMTCSIFFGFMLGTVAGTHIPLLAEDDVVGITKMSSAAGVYVFIQSFAGLAGPPLAGNSKTFILNFLFLVRLTAVGADLHRKRSGSATHSAVLKALQPALGGSRSQKAAAVQLCRVPLLRNLGAEGNAAVLPCCCREPRAGSASGSGSGGSRPASTLPVFLP